MTTSDLKIDVAEVTENTAVAKHGLSQRIGHHKKNQDRQARFIVKNSPGKER